MKKFVYIAIYWYLKTFKGLNISSTIKAFKLFSYQKFLI